MAYIVKELRQEELLRLLLAGFNLKDSAAHLKVTKWTVQRYLRETDFMDRLKEENREIWEEVDAELRGNKLSIVQRAEEAAEDALEEMIKLAKEGKQEAVRFKAAQDLMDRDTRISRTKRLEGGEERRPILNAVILQQAAAAIREEESVRGEIFVDSGTRNNTPIPRPLPSLPAEGTKPTNQLPLFEEEG